VLNHSYHYLQQVYLNLGQYSLGLPSPEILPELTNLSALSSLIPN